MPTVGLRNQEAQAIGEGDHLSVFDRNFAAEWYDSGNFGSNYIAAITVPLAATRYNSSAELFVMASNILTITEAGLYLFQYTVHSGPEAAGDGGFYAFLQQDPDTGTFADIPASMAAGASVAAVAITVHGSVLLKVDADYRYRLMTASFGSNYQLRGAGLGAPNGSRLSVMRLYNMGGVMS